MFLFFCLFAVCFTDYHCIFLSELSLPFAVDFAVWHRCKQFHVAVHVVVAIFCVPPPFSLPPPTCLPFSIYPLGQSTAALYSSRSFGKNIISIYMCSVNVVCVSVAVCVCHCVMCACVCVCLMHFSCSCCIFVVVFCCC